MILDQCTSVRPWRDAHHADEAAHDHGVDDLLEGIGAAAHFQPDIKAFAHAEIRHDIAQVFFQHVNGSYIGDLLRQRQAIGVDIGEDNMAGFGEARDSGCHRADGAGAGDQDILADDIEGKDAVNGIAQGIEYGADFQGKIVGQGNDVKGGDDQVFGKSAGTIYANATGIGVQVKASRRGRCGCAGR